MICDILIIKRKFCNFTVRHIWKHVEFNQYRSISSLLLLVIIVITIVITIVIIIIIIIIIFIFVSNTFVLIVSPSHWSLLTCNTNT